MLKSSAGTLIARLSSTQFALTGHDEYIPLFRSNIDAPEAFVKVVRGEIIPQIKQDAYSALINLSSDPFIAETLVRPRVVAKCAIPRARAAQIDCCKLVFPAQVDNSHNLLIPELVTEILDPKSEFADKACIVLANLTRNTEHAVVRVLKVKVTQSLRNHALVRREWTHHDALDICSGGDVFLYSPPPFPSYGHR
jgi:hypothetical protein